MPEPSSARDMTTVVTRLRAAGCVFAEDEAELLGAAAGSDAELDVMVGRRADGVPLEHVVGWAEFCGLRIELDPGVFVPRRRSKLLVQSAASLTMPHDTVIDMCCGSGAVGVAVAHRVGPIALFAADIDAAAVACARRNLAPIGGEAFAGDLFAPLPRRLIGYAAVIVVNAPYVPTSAVAYMPREARLFEPPAALDGGPDGLDIQRRVVDAAGEWLRPSGHLLIETSDEQADATAGLFTVAGYAARVVRSGELDATVVIGARRFD